MISLSGKMHAPCSYYLVMKQLLLLINKRSSQMTIHAGGWGWGGWRRGGGEKPFFITSTRKHTVGRMCWWQPPASTAFPPLQLHHTVQGLQGPEMPQHTHTHIHSHIQAYTGPPLASQSFLCMPKITDLMAYLFPSGWTRREEAVARPHRNTD